MEGFNRPERPPLHRSQTAQADYSPLKTRTNPHSKRLPFPHPHHHHHLNPLHLHHHHRDKTVPQSALSALPGLGTHAAGEWANHPSALPAKSAGGTPVESRIASRRESLSLAEEKDGTKSNRQSFDKMRKKPKQDLAVEAAKAKEKHKERVKAVMLSLLELATTAASASRSIDGTYYAVLEKASILRSTVSSLQELSTRTYTLHHDFKDDADELVRDVTDQIDTVSATEDSQARIDELEQRIQAGRTKVIALGQRLEAVRQNVEHWEQQEQEWQAKTSRRLRMLWGGALTCVFVFVALLVVHRFRDSMPSNTLMMAKSNGSATAANLTLAPGTNFTGPRVLKPTKSLTIPFQINSDDDDGCGTLKIFDEL
ncbi:MAG: hypothetical protein M1814_005736 [Vezdaea aestivalis]|nr:MAG: hypothetical protein M1814_005736 [Vezdaea aestivalis]